MRKFVLLTDSACDLPVETAQKQADKVVATIGNEKLTNAQLQIYYWTQVYDFISNYGQTYFDVTADIGSTAFLKVTSDCCGHYGENAGWYRNDVKLTAGSKYYPMGDTLAIQNVDATDAGTYTYKCANAHNIKVEANVKLTVLLPDSYLEQIINILVNLTNNMIGVTTYKKE